MLFKSHKDEVHWLNDQNDLLWLRYASFEPNGLVAHHEHAAPHLRL